MEQQFETIKANLEKRGYEVSVFADAEEACAYLNKEIDGKTVGIGGSTTVNQMGLYEQLEGHNEVFWHWRLKEGGLTEQQIYTKSQTAQIYISSVNGIAETGEIINIDGFANRVSACLYGHEKVYFVVGKNKIAKDFDGALWRARNIAAPKNARRIGKNLPCAKEEERCYDCQSPERICRALTVLWKPVTSCRMEVVLIGQELGF